MTSRKIPESAVENLVSDLEGKANVSNTVTTNTNQTIGGQKTFTTQLLRKSTDIDVTSQATSSTYSTGIRFFDKNLKDIGAVNNAQMNNGDILTQLEARNKDNYVTSIGIRVPYEGSTGGYGFAPNTPDNAPGNAIVTKNKIANMVTTNKEQTITGMKTFSASAKWQNAGGGNPHLLIFSDGFTLDGTKPSDFAHSSIYFRSNSSVEGVNDSNTLGCVEVIQSTNMTLPDLNFLIRNPNQSGWVGKFQVVSALPANPDSRVFYFIPE